MSIFVSSLVWQADLPFAEQHVLLALADHAWDDGSHVYPSIDYTSWKTNMGVRTVQENMRKLEARNILLPVAHIQGGRKKPTVYRIVLENIPLKEKYGPIADPLADETQKGAGDAPFRRGMQKGAVDAPFTQQKGADDDQKGADDDQKGAAHAEKGAAGAPEPSLTIKNRNVKETYARAREEISFDNQKQKTAEAERPRSLPTAGNTARLPEVTPLPDPTPPVAPPPLAPAEPAPKPESNYGTYCFLSWQQTLAQMDNQYTKVFIHQHLEPCKLYKRRPGQYVLVCRNEFALEQINIRARDRIVMYLSAVVREHVELEVVSA